MCQALVAREKRERLELTGRENKVRFDTAWGRGDQQTLPSKKRLSTKTEQRGVEKGGKHSICRVRVAINEKEDLAERAMRPKRGFSCVRQGYSKLSYYLERRAVPERDASRAIGNVGYLPF